MTFRPRLVRKVKNEEPANFWRIAFEIWRISMELLPDKDDVEYEVVLPENADTIGCMALRINNVYIAERHDEETGFSLHIEHWGNIYLGHLNQPEHQLLYSQRVSKTIAAKEFVRHMLEACLQHVWERTSQEFEEESSLEGFSS